MEKIYLVLFGYLIGCAQVPYLVSKYIYKVDLRKEGSGNLGSTNVLRTLGKKVGITVLILDILKVIIACYIATKIFTGLEDVKSVAVYTGLGAIIGHDFPFYLKFKGGKGAASTLGMVIYINWIVGISVFILGLIITKIKGYVSVASMVSLTLSTVIFYLLGYSGEVVIVSFILSMLTVIQHKENIKRLIKGTESKLGKKKGEKCQKK